MPPENERQGRWSQLADFASSTRGRLLRYRAKLLTRSPRPVRQGWRLIERTMLETFHDRVPGLAAEAALFTLISLPALLLALIGSLGFIASALGPEGAHELRRVVLGIPDSFLSGPTYASYERVVGTILAQTHGSVVSIGILLSVWTGSRAVNRYLETMTIAYDLDPRAGWRQRLLALGLTVGGLIGAVAVLPPLVVGPRILRWLAPDSVADTTLRVFNMLFLPGVGLVVLMGLATLYHVGVPWRTPWRRDLPGALLAMGLWLLASAALRTYLTLSVQSDAVFSQLAVPIAVVLWLYITAFAVLLGAEFNAEIERMWPHEDHPWRLGRLLRRVKPHQSGEIQL
ncbi:hypothetical protein BH09ACT8_BH09ACT8_32550 [soil metagenome]